MTREDVWSALWQRVSADPIWISASRKLLHWNDVNPAAMPALFLSQGRESYATPAAKGLPPKRTLNGTLHLYVSTGDGISPGEALNPLLDILDAALGPTPVGPQTLGGLVEWARIEGDIETFEGTLGSIEVALVPIRILLP